jgi:hypothetical protein
MNQSAVAAAPDLPRHPIPGDRGREFCCALQVAPPVHIDDGELRSPGYGI